MSEPKIELVESKAFTINLPSIGEAMTIRTESDEIVILMSLTLRPRDNVMDLSVDVSTSGDSAAMSGFNKNTSTDFSRYWRTRIPA